MSVKRTLHYIRAVLLCAALAQPSTLWAKDSAHQGESLSATDGAPVSIYSVGPNGSEGYYVVTEVSESSGPHVLNRLAATDADRLLVAVDGPQDPALKTLRKSGYLKKVQTFVVNAKTAASNLTARATDRVRAISDFCKAKRGNLIGSFVAASAIAGFTFYSSSSVEGGLGILAMLTTLYSFQSARSHDYERLLHKSSSYVREVAGRGLAKIGHEMTAEEKGYYEATGQFLTTWALNTVVAAAVLHTAGHLESFTQAAWFGFLTNYDVWGAVVLSKMKQGKVSLQFAEKYMLWQFGGGVTAEFLNYNHVPYVQQALEVTVLSGLVYLLVGHHFERGVYDFRSKVTNRLFNKKDCENALVPFYDYSPETFD